MKYFKIFIISGLIIIAIAIFAYRNMNYDYLNEDFLEKEGFKLGFRENIFKLKDGSEIYYIEGPNNGPSLLLLHGQQVSCYDYKNVLPKLSKEFHIYTLDYYGHGNSSKNLEKYNAVKIGEDIISFIKEVIKEETYIAGHSSGALIAAYVASNSSDIIGTVLEDGPFFSVEKGRAEDTISWLSFKTMHDYLNQEEYTSFIKYSLEYDYMKEVFNSKSPGAWEKLVKNPALKYMEKHPNEIPKIWYYPPELGINSLYALNANMQDKTGKYDLRFGVSFYDFSWLEGYDFEEVLENIKTPVIVMQVDPSEITYPSYYDSNGILLSAMDEKDAKRVLSLLPNGRYIGGFKSDHNIHQDLPEEYIKVLMELKSLK